MHTMLFLHSFNLVAGAAPGVLQVTNMLTTIESDLVRILMVLGPVVFLVGLAAHGISSSHNSQNGAAWANRAMRAGGAIFVGALVVDLMFSLLQGFFG